MATSASYFLNAPSLGSATAIFTDAGLSVCAANGFYSDGVIVREQVNCVLLPQQVCPACPFPPTPCGSTINASGGQGVFLIDIEAGANTGAVIVRFDPQAVPDGIRATLGANVFNKLTSPVDGFHQTSNAGAFTYVGATGNDCGISGSTYLLQEFVYNGTMFVSTGSGQDVTVAAGDVSLGASAPGNMMMVIPKTVASPSIINFEVVGPCIGTAWNMSVACPVLLTGFSSSVMGASSEAVCALAETVTNFNASLVNTPGIVGLNDFVFSDAFGSTQLAAGFYYAAGSIIGGNEWFEVSANGIVVAIGMCPTPPCSLTIYFDSSATPSPGGWASSTDACEGTGTPLTIYTIYDPICPTTFQEIFTDGKAMYLDDNLTTPLAGNNNWFKTEQSPNSGFALQVDNSGFISQISSSCPPPPAANQKYFATDCGTSSPRVLVINGSTLTLGAVYRITSETASTCFTIDSDEPTSDPVTYIESSTPSASPIAFELEPGGCESVNCNQV